MSKTPYLNKQLADFVFAGKVPDFAVDNEYYLSFHKKFPKSQSEHEVSFEGYKRVLLDKTSNMWDVRIVDEDVEASNKKEIDIPSPEAKTEAKFKYVAVGRTLDADGDILYIVEVEETKFLLGQPQAIPKGGAKLIDIYKVSNG